MYNLQKENICFAMHVSVNAITNCFRIPFQPSQATFTEIGLPADEIFKIMQKMSELSKSI